MPEIFKVIKAFNVGEFDFIISYNCNSENRTIILQFWSKEAFCNQFKSPELKLGMVI